MLPRLLSGCEFIPCILSSKPSLFGWRQRPLQSSALARDVSGDTEQAALLRAKTWCQELLVEGERQSCATSWQDKGGKEPSSLQEEISHVCALNLIYSG